MLLYQMHELGRAWMAPMTYWADAGAKMFGAPGSWLSTVPGATRVAAGYESIYQRARQTAVEAPGELRRTGSPVA